MTGLNVSCGLLSCGVRRVLRTVAPWLAQVTGVLLLSGATLDVIVTAVAPQTFADLGAPIDRLT